MIPAKRISARKALLTCGLAATLTMGLVAPAAQAQEVSTNMVDAIQDWAVHEKTSPKECWAVTTFTESLNTSEDGRLKAVSRGDILLMVFFRPAEGVQGQVAFTGGYPFAPDSFVQVTIGSSKFEMFTDGEWAWPTSPDQDAEIVAAMKRGAKAVLSARSSRGTVTKDTFSLQGFTAAFNEAAARCPS